MYGIVLVVHDISSRLKPTNVLPYAKSASKKSDDNNDFNEDDFDEDDTILSSIGIHSSDIPKYKITSELKSNESTSPSCRAVLFDTAGQHLYTAGNGGTLACLDVDKASHYSTSDLSLLWKIDNASPHGINVLYQLPESSPAGPLVVTGDDEGVVRLWDMSLIQRDDSSSSKGHVNKTAFDGLLDLPHGCLASFHEHKDYISGLETNEEGNTLLVSSADGTMSIIDLSKGSGANKVDISKGHQKQPIVKSGKFNLIRKSDDQEDELLSVCIIKGGKKVLCGTQNGIINVWSWGTWGDISDRFPGHPQSIDAILKVDEDTVLTGSSDGVVRVVQIHPDRFLGVLGDHGGFPIEKLIFSRDKKVLGSVSHDISIRLWDSSILFNDDDNDDKGDCNMDEDNEIEANAKSGNNSDDEWEDFDDSEDDDDNSMDDSDDSDSKDGKGKKRRFKTENEQFFEDL